MPKNRLGKVSFTSHRYHVIRKYESIQSVKSEVATRSREKKHTHKHLYKAAWYCRRLCECHENREQFAFRTHFTLCNRTTDRTTDR